jgi:Ran GTPase-activating protein (RanGAP) involved in mRNA processing and transport
MSASYGERAAHRPAPPPKPRRSSGDASTSFSPISGATSTPPRRVIVANTFFFSLRNTQDKGETPPGGGGGGNSSAALSPPSSGRTTPLRAIHQNPLVALGMIPDPNAREAAGGGGGGRGHRGSGADLAPPDYDRYFAPSLSPRATTPQRPRRATLDAQQLGMRPSPPSMAKSSGARSGASTPGTEGSTRSLSGVMPAGHSDALTRAITEAFFDKDKTPAASSPRVAMSAEAARLAMPPPPPRSTGKPGADMIAKASSHGGDVRMPLSFSPKPPPGAPDSAFRRSAQTSPVNSRMRRCTSLGDDGGSDDDEGDELGGGGFGGFGGGLGGGGGGGGGGGLVRCGAVPLDFDDSSNISTPVSSRNTPHPTASFPPFHGHAPTTSLFLGGGGTSLFLGSPAPAATAPHSPWLAGPSVNSPPPALPGGLTLPVPVPLKAPPSPAQRAHQVAEFTAAARHSCVVLHRRGLGQTDVEDLAVALSDNTTVTMLDLDHNSISDQGCPVIGKLFERLARLESVSLEDNAIHPVGAISLAGHLGNNTTLKSLLLGENYIGSSGIAVLGPAIASSALTGLSLRENFLTEKGIIALAAATKDRWKTITSLDLSCNYIGSEGALGILAVLPSTLTKLNLTHNLIGPEAAVGFTTALAEHPALTSLRVDRNRKLGALACEQILIAAARSPVLRELSLCDCGVTGVSFLACVPYLKRNTSLQTLNLTDNSISADETSKYWEGLFQENRTLTNVRVTDRALQDIITGHRISTAL